MIDGNKQITEGKERCDFNDPLRNPPSSRSLYEASPPWLLFNVLLRPPYWLRTWL